MKDITQFYQYYASIHIFWQSRTNQIKNTMMAADGPNDSDLESDSQLPPQAPLQQAPQQAPPRQQAVDLSICSHFAALEMEVANKTSDSFLKDFQQKWKSQLPAQGQVVNSIRPGGHMQRERLNKTIHC